MKQISNASAIFAASAVKTAVSLPSRGQHPGLAILPRDQGVGFRVVNDFLGFGVPANLPADAISDVAEMSGDARLVLFLDVREGALPLFSVPRPF